MAIRSNVIRAFFFVLAFTLAQTPNAMADTLEYGKPGTPVTLSVGNPCCYAAIWSAFIVREKELWKKYLPSGSKVTFEVALAGPPILNGMFAGKIQIGYLGDVPAIIATTKSDLADVRLVATTAISYDQCNILLVRADAPAFTSSQDAVKWLDGKQVAAPRGTCGDRFAQDIFKRENVKPASYLNQTIEVITSGFRAGKLDGAAIWEPVASQIINQKLARRAASGATYKISDAAFVAMRGDLIDSRPDVAQGWVDAELEAERFLANPANEDEVISIIQKYVPGFGADDLRGALYRKYPANEGGIDARITQPFTFTPEVRELIAEDVTFLYSIKGVPTDKIRPNAIEDKFAEQALKSQGLKSPIGKVVGK
jgi:NitT/TauT family transport system substrate-binding protein